MKTRLPPKKTMADHSGDYGKPRFSCDPSRFLLDWEEEESPMTTAAKKADIQFTYRDDTLLPEDKRYELIEGDLLMTPAPTSKHPRIAFRIARRLDAFVRDRGIKRKLYAR